MTQSTFYITGAYIRSPLFYYAILRGAKPPTHTNVTCMITTISPSYEQPYNTQAAHLMLFLECSLSLPAHIY